MTYFDHQYVSNSDLKEVFDLHTGRSKPDNIQEIYDLGSLNHHVLLEPHKADRNHPEYALATTMANTVLKDKLCQQIIMMQDFRREHEWYKIRNAFGLSGVRIKTDGDSKMASTIFEYKGLAVTTVDAFHAAIQRFHYDQSAAYYLEATGYKNYLIVGVSKKKPSVMFKLLIDRDHEYYHSGMAKIYRGVRIWHNWDFN